MTSYTLIITSKADNDEERIYKYIRKEFGETYADKFRKKLIHLFNLLVKQPFIGRPANNKPNFRVFIFAKQNKIVYQVHDREIIIIRILNTKSSLASKF